MDNTDGTTDPATSNPERAVESALTEEHCWQLLASSRVARVAFVEDGLPQLVVLNYRPEGRDLLFQTNEQSRLAARTAGGDALAVAAEVDSSSVSERSGWSVIASGSLSRTTADDIERAPVPWRPEAVGVLLRMRVTRIDGRHVGDDT